MKTFKVAVLISGNGSNLQSLIDNFKKESLIDIKCVISNKENAFGLERATEANIDNFFVDHTKFKSREEFDQELIKILEEYDPDLIVLAGFMRILSKYFVKNYKGIILNIHPSLLPKYKGLNTHERVIKNKEIYSGCTVHYVNYKLDSGKIIIQKKVKIRQNDTPNSLSKRILNQEHKLYPKAILKIFNL